MALQRNPMRTRLAAVRDAVVSTPVEGLEPRQLFALTVTNASGSTLTNALVSPNTGITVTNTAYVGAATQGATYSGFNFTSGATNLAIANGILLTNGLASNVTQVSTGSTGTTDTGSDADLTALIGGTATNDVNSLTLTFTTTPGTKSIAFDFIFGSEEFPEFVGSFNDPFGAFLDGKQISFDSNKKPISVNNNFFTLNNSGDTTDPDAAGKTVVSFSGLGVDGLTPKITTTAPLDATKTTHTLKFAIADAGDTALDSSVFISALRGDDKTTTGPTTGQPPTADAGGPYTVAFGGSVKLAGKGTDPDQTPASLIYSWDLDGDGIFGETGAAAANGAETGPTPTFTAGTLAAGTVKTVTLKVTDNTGLTATDTATVTVGPQTSTPTASAGGPYTINEGGSLTLSASSSGVANAIYSFDVNGDGVFGDATGQNPTLTAAQLKVLGIADGNATSTYAVKVKVTAGGTTTSTTSAGTTLTVKNVAPTVSAGPDKTLATPGTAVTLTGTASDPAGALDPLTYSWVVKNAANVTVATGTSLAITFTPATSGVFTATLTANDGDGGITSDSALVTVGTVVTPTGPTIISYTLVNATTKKDIEVITEGTVLNLATLPKSLNIRANTSLTGSGKVLFGYDAISGQFVANYRLELGAPFALFGDFPGGNYFGKVLGLGSHTLSGTASTYTGSTGATKTLHFSVINGTVTPVLPSTPTATAKAPPASVAVDPFKLVGTSKKKDLVSILEGASLSVK